jgi:hypothetical protein
VPVYRIEDEQGCGPYIDKPIGLGIDFSKQPEPEDDEMFAFEINELGLSFDHDDSPNSIYNGDFRFGFKSIEQFQYWFTQKNLQKLIVNGFALVEYEVLGLVVEGWTQLVFEKKGSTKTNTISLRQFLTPTA